MVAQRKRIAEAERLRQLREEDEDDFADGGSLEQSMIRDLMNSVDLRPVSTSQLIQVHM